MSFCYEVATLQGGLT